MPEWFDRAFGAAADEMGRAISDTRSKLVDEAWFGRRTPEPQRQNDLGWSLAERPTPPEQGNPDHERDHGIDR